MLIWQEISETTHDAVTELFRYVIEAIDGQLYWSVWAGETLLQTHDRLGPSSLYDAKIAAQKDYDARIEHAQKVIDHGRYTRA